MSKFFEDREGNKSSSRLITFIVVIFALIYAGAILWFGRDTVIAAASASGLCFTTIAGSSLVWMYNQKKRESDNK